MNPLDPYKSNNSTLDAMRHLQESGTLAAVHELQAII